MKSNRLLILICVWGCFSLSGCSARLVDFTTISSKNVNLDFDKSQGQQVEATESYIFGFGWNIKDALDEALEKAGPEYDILVDGVVRYGSYFVVATVSVEGTAISSSQMRESLGEAGFQEWLKEHEVFTPQNAMALEE